VRIGKAESFKPKALLDANVLYPATLRDLLLWLAVERAYIAHWTERIHEEWTRNVLLNQPQLTESQLDRTRQLMDTALPSALISNFEHYIEPLTLPDPKDRHVLAAAIQAESHFIVTRNLRDFPTDLLEPFGIAAIHPDAFLMHLAEHDPDTVLHAIALQRDNFKRPVLSRQEYFERLAHQGLKEFVAWLQERVPLE
jgi:predicted nucleic acid-binding protein